MQLYWKNCMTWYDINWNECWRHTKIQIFEPFWVANLPFWATIKHFFIITTGFWCIFIDTFSGNSSSHKTLFLLCSWITYNPSACVVAYQTIASSNWFPFTTINVQYNRIFRIIKRLMISVQVRFITDFCLDI